MYGGVDGWEWGRERQREREREREREERERNYLIPYTPKSLNLCTFKAVSTEIHNRERRTAKCYSVLTMHTIT